LNSKATNAQMGHFIAQYESARNMAETIAIEENTLRTIHKIT